MKHRNGFTQIELSIVLIVIGLIVGGIAVGQTLIRSAKLKNIDKEVSGFGMQRRPRNHQPLRPEPDRRGVPHAILAAIEIPWMATAITTSRARCHQSLKRADYDGPR